MNITQPLNLLSNPFEFAKHGVRTAIGSDQQIWFCARDVFDALDITWNGHTSLKHYLIGGKR